MTSQNPDVFLAHFGVAGMKWGKSKSRYLSGGTDRKSRNAAETKYQIDKYGGSKTKAVLVAGGKNLATQVLLVAGNKAVNTIAGNNPYVQAGSNTITRILGAASAISTTVDQVRIVKAKR